MPGKTHIHEENIEIGPVSLRPKKPRPVEPAMQDSYGPGKYPSHRPIDESSKLCRIHEKRQKRTIEMIGPMDEFYCRTVPVKNPRNSHWLMWKIIPILCWLIPPVKGRWYVIKVAGSCPDCHPHNHAEKLCRREMGIVHWKWFMVKVWLKPELFSVTPFDPTKKQW